MARRCLCPRVYSGDLASTDRHKTAVCDSRITEYGGREGVQGEAVLEADQLSTGMLWYARKILQERQYRSKARNDRLMAVFTIGNSSYLFSR